MFENFCAILGLYMILLHILQSLCFLGDDWEGQGAFYLFRRLISKVNHLNFINHVYLYFQSYTTQLWYSASLCFHHDKSQVIQNEVRYVNLSPFCETLDNILKEHIHVWKIVLKRVYTSFHEVLTIINTEMCWTTKVDNVQ